MGCNRGAATARQGTDNGFLTVAMNGGTGADKMHGRDLKLVCAPHVTEGAVGRGSACGGQCCGSN
jgi:hypothetical protein